MKSKSRSLLQGLFFLSTTWSVVVVGAARQLVVIAGPTETGASRIHEFLDSFATNYKDNDDDESDGPKIKGWLWPTLREEDYDLVVGEDISRSDIFKLLFYAQDDAPIQLALTNAMRDAWQDSTHGIIVGSVKFDKVGETPYTRYDALSTVFRIKEELSALNRDVTIVMLYRRRVEQWGGLFDHSGLETYNEFVCSTQKGDKSWEYLDTSMDPLRIAADYRRAGFNVIMVDEEGTLNMGGDIAHATMCALSGVECNDGWISGLTDQETGAPLTHDIAELDEGQLNDIENMMRHRDCYWKDTLIDDPNFQVVNRRDFFDGCGDDVKSEVKFANTDNLLYALKLQLDCAGDFDDSNATASSYNEGGGLSKNIFYAIVAIVMVILALSVFSFYKKRSFQSGKNVVVEGIFHDDVIKLPRSPFSGDIPNRPFSDTETGEADATDEATSSDEDEVFGKSTPKTLMTGTLKATGNPSTPPGLAFAGHKTKDGDLCKACKLVRLDPNCSFCHGGRKRAAATMEMLDELSFSTVYDETNAVHMCSYCTSNIGSPDPECVTCNGSKTTVGAFYDDLNDRWQGEAGQHCGSNHSSVRLGGLENVDHRAGLERQGKSNVLNKLKKLLDLKNNPDDSVNLQTNPDGLLN